MSLILQAGKLRCQAGGEPTGLPSELASPSSSAAWDTESAMHLGAPGHAWAAGNPRGQGHQEVARRLGSHAHTGRQAVPNSWLFLHPTPNSSQASAGELGALKSNSQPPVSLGLLVGLCGLHRKITFWPTWDCALLRKRHEPPRRRTWKTHSRTRGQAGLTGH